MASYYNMGIQILASILSLLLVKLALSRICAPKMPMPPGPKPLPLVGNLFQLPEDSHYKMYHEWCKKLDTDVLYLSILGSSFVILDTYEACIELLDKRSSIYSSRPRMPMINELMGWDFNFAFMDYGNTWRRRRKLMHQEFNPTAVKEYRSHETKAARGLLKRLKGEVDNVVSELQQLSGETILSITYGITIQPSNDPYIEMAKAGVHPILEAAVPGTFLVDTFPWLKFVPEWFPGAEFQRKAREWRKSARNMVNIPFAVTKEAMKKGTAEPSFMTKCLDSVDNNLQAEVKVYEEDVKSVCGTLYQGGSDTTATALASCILALLEHPDVLKKAQAEIDSVILGTLPDFCDEESLPYVTAIAKETLRWRIVAPIGCPHVATSDDIYNGYRIPPGSTLIPNVWAILRDENVFPDPESFIPERFMKSDAVAERRLDVVWGFGRRVCSGRYMAFSTIWITLASIIAVFDISKAVDENGQVIQPSHKYSNSIVPFPYPFKAVFKPRNTKAEALIKGDIDI